MKLFHVLSTKETGDVYCVRTDSGEDKAYRLIAVSELRTKPNQDGSCTLIQLAHPVLALEEMVPIPKSEVK